MYFQFNVDGWLNTQVVEGDSEDKAWDKALEMAREEEIRCWREVSKAEAAQIMD